MTDDPKPNPRHDANERRAAQARLKAWIDLPRHQPSKEDDEKTRTGDITDPALQEKEA